MAALRELTWKPIAEVGQKQHYLHKYSVWLCKCPAIEPRDLEDFLNKLDPYSRMDRGPLRRAHKAVKELLTQVSPDAG